MWVNFFTNETFTGGQMLTVSTTNLAQFPVFQRVLLADAPSIILDSPQGLTTAQIVGIVIGSALGGLLLILFCVLCKRVNTRKRIRKATESHREPMLDDDDQEDDDDQAE